MKAGGPNYCACFVNIADKPGSTTDYTQSYVKAYEQLSLIHILDWNTAVQNLLNWADKGAMQLNKLIPALKKIALQDGAIVNVDETWLRYHCLLYTSAYRALR